MQAAAARAEKAALERKLEEVQLSCAAGQADVAALKRDLAALDAKARVHLLISLRVGGFGMFCVFPDLSPMYACTPPPADYRHPLQSSTPIKLVQDVR